jgi:hypothetical protein
MKKHRSPREKKDLSYDRDGRNAYGENDKASRKAVPRRKRLRARATRRLAKQQLPRNVADMPAEQAEQIDAIIAAAKHKYDWRKKPDIRLREWVERGRKRREAVIYVELLNEAVPVWRPVAATREAPGVYRLPVAKPDDEAWAYSPGSCVRVEWQLLAEGQQLVAVALAGR